MDRKVLGNLGDSKAMAENINRLLLEKEKSRKDLADALGVGYTTVASWCQGYRYPSIANIEKMAKYFGVDKVDLVEKEGSRLKAVSVLIESIEKLPDTQVEHLIAYVKLLESESKKGE